MSRKTLLAIAASAELFLGAYCVLAFVAWTARIYLFTAGKAEFSPVLIVWAALAAGCFFLYSKTMDKIHELEAMEATELKRPVIDPAPDLDIAQESAEESHEEAAAPTLKG